MEKKRKGYVTNCSFLHASDLHFGSHQYRSLPRAEDFIRIFQKICELAQQKQVDCILLSGDIFTSINILPHLFQKIIKILKAFQIKTKNAIPILAIEGNHDRRRVSHGKKYKRGPTWVRCLAELGLLILLDAKQTNDGNLQFYYVKNGIKKPGAYSIKFMRLYGTKYNGQSPSIHIKQLSQSLPNSHLHYTILLQHFGIAGQMKGVPGVKLKQLQSLRPRVNYLALGHFHKSFHLQKWIFNPGSAEAVAISEHSYLRGVFYGKITNKGHEFHKRVTLIQLPNRKFTWIELRVPFSINSREDMVHWLHRALFKKIRMYYQKRIIYVKIKGPEIPWFKKTKKTRLQKELREKFQLTEVRIFLKCCYKRHKTLNDYLNPRSSLAPF